MQRKKVLLRKAKVSEMKRMIAIKCGITDCEWKKEADLADLVNPYMGSELTEEWLKHRRTLHNIPPPIWETRVVPTVEEIEKTLDVMNEDEKIEKGEYDIGTTSVIFSYLSSGSEYLNFEADVKLVASDTCTLRVVSEHADSRFDIALTDAMMVSLRKALWVCVK